MRVAMRRVVDLDDSGSVDLRPLTPFQKIITSFMISLRNTTFVKNRLRKDEQAVYKEKLMREEELKSVILGRLYTELIKNNFMGEKGLSASSVILEIDRSMEQTLLSIKDHKDFMSYNINIIQPDPDMLRCFKDIPILLEASRKTVEEG